MSKTERDNVIPFDPNLDFGPWFLGFVFWILNLLYHFITPIMSTQPYSFFQSVERSFDKAAKSPLESRDIRADQSLQQCAATTFPFKRDDEALKY